MCFKAHLQIRNGRSLLIDGNQIFDKQICCCECCCVGLAMVAVDTVRLPDVLEFRFECLGLAFSH